MDKGSMCCVFDPLLGLKRYMETTEIFDNWISALSIKSKSWGDPT